MTNEPSAVTKPALAMQSPWWSPQAVVKPVVSAVILVGVFLWSFWPTLVDLWSAWMNEPDYSHGLLVFPLAVGFLWLRRDRFPGLSEGEGQDARPMSLGWLALVVLIAAFGIRVAGALFFVKAADGWAIPFFAAGAVLLLGGWALFRWSLPSIGFLFFMVPLPYHVERWFSSPLQRVAANLGSFGLHLLGQPALVEGNTIWLEKYQLEVEQACSGLRIFMAITAVAFAYVIVARNAWWEKALLLAATAPIALFSNAVRIVTTGLLYRYSSSEAARVFAHDGAGWAMILFAALLFSATLWYLGRLFPVVEQVSVQSMLTNPSLLKN